MLSESQPSRVQLQTFPAAQGTDAVTAQTVGIMCSYIKDACADPVIRLAAQHALKNYGQDANDPAMRAWAAFWFVKHQVKFVVDEAPMMRLGRPNEQDLLMSPSVLIRMDKPQEDCDGFTMLGAALLKCLNVPFTIVTIAASADDPSRWSHVFLMAHTGKQWLPLDMSHGSGPGWIVPAAHTYRWQCWDENGQPVEIQRPGKHSLHGYVGMGQTDCTLNPDSSDCIDYTPVTSGTVSSDPTTTGVTPWGTVATTPGSVAGANSYSPSSFNLTSFLNTLTTQAASVAKVAEGQQPVSTLGSSLGSLLPYVGVGLIAWLLISSLGNRR